MSFSVSSIALQLSEGSLKLSESLSGSLKLCTWIRKIIYLLQNDLRQHNAITRLMCVDEIRLLGLLASTAVEISVPFKLRNIHATRNAH